MGRVRGDETQAAATDGKGQTKGAGGGLSRRRFVGIAAAVGTGAPFALHAAVREEERSALQALSGQAPPLIVASLPLASPLRDREAVRAALGQAAEAGVEVVFVPVATVEDYQGASRNLLRLKSYVESFGDLAALARRPADVARARRAGRVAVVPHFQGLQMVVEDLPLIREFSAGGVGVMALTHHWKNWNGDGCLERTDLRMTGLGELVIREMNDAGVVVDLSRAGPRTSLHAMEVSRHPVIFSNSNAARIHDHPRNLSDAQIDACAAGGGVVGVTAFPTFTGPGRPSLDRLLDHVEYLVNRAGPQHVGLGLGFTDRVEKRFPSDPLPDEVPSFPSGLEGIDRLDALRWGLDERGLGGDVAAGLMGGNLWRVLEEVWSEA